MLGPLLGKGGMGEVLEAWDVVLCRTVALKALRNMDPAALIRFMHEAQIQARVIHPNICRIYDIETSEGTLKIAMQLIKGPNLEQAAKQLTMNEAVAIIRDMAEAVHAAHRVNLIHRDLKPSNIILERSSDGQWVPYLCDFGLAVSVGEPSMTLSHAVVGTPAFMAPEQNRGSRDQISPATDVYALGGTLHFALLGHPPGKLGTTSDPWRPPKLNLPRDLTTVIRKCLESDPANRYATAAALAADLGRFLEGRPVDARPRGPLDRAFRLLPQRGSRLLALGWFLATLGLTLAAGLAWTLRTRTGEEALVRDLQVASAGMLWNHAAEQVLPVHDLRPSRSRLRTRMAEILERVKGAGPRARGAGWFALGQGHLLLGEGPEARSAFEHAATLGYGEPSLAPLMLRALAEASYWSPESRKDPEAERWARLPGSTGEQDLLLEARSAFILGDYSTAARIAREVGEKSPHLVEPVELEGAALCALGRRAFNSGELAGARALFMEAADSTWRRTGFWSSDAGLRHAFARASLALAELDLERGARPIEGLRLLAGRCDEALRLDPGDPSLREDWLASRFLLARGQAAQGADPRQALEEALAFLESRSPGPGARTRACRMVICWQLADFEFRNGQDPGASLKAALENAVPTPAFNRDYLGAVLNLKARVEAAGGRDPRPAVEEALRSIGAAHSWERAETAAEAWYIRAEWETGKAMDASASLAQVLTLTDRALGARSGAGAANALKGLALVLEMRRDPSRRALLLPAVRQQLKSARSAGGGGHLVDKLERALPGLS